MDLSFSIQALTAEFIIKNHNKLEKKVYPVPSEIDHNVAKIALKNFGIEKDELTDEQIEYIRSWNVGT